MSDLRLAIRQLFKHPGFTGLVVLMLALGIGLNTAMFSVIDGVLLKPLPYPEPDRLVALWERSPERGVEQEPVSGPNYLDWLAQNTVFSALAVSPAWEGSERFNLVLHDTTLKVRGAYASASLFMTFGTAPLLGRPLLPEEDRPGGNPAAVVSWQLWRQSFAGDSNVIGRTLTLDSYGRRSYTIVGVMPPGFGTPGYCDLWLSLGQMGVRLDERRSAHWHDVIGRLKPGVTLARARQELNAIQARIKKAYPGEMVGSEVAVVPLLDQALGRNLKRALWILWAVVAGVLLISCANVANLWLVRAATRQKEFALRLALGAGRWRVMRQLFAESLLLAVLGGALGAWLGGLGLQLLILACPAEVPRLAAVALDRTAFGFTFGVSVLTGLLFGFAPAWAFSRPNLNEALKEASPAASTGRHATRVRHGLIVAEVALSVVLLAGAGLMLQAFSRMLRADRGFRPEHLLTAELDFSVSGFTTWVEPTGTRPQVALRQVLERVRSLPGVEAVGASSQLLRRQNQPPHERFTVFGWPVFGPDEQPKAEFTGIAPGWRQALGVHLLRGRDVSESDTLQNPGVVLVNQTLARRFFGTSDPIGQHLKMGSAQSPLNSTDVRGLPEWNEIVGVVSDVKSLHPQPEAVPEVYKPYCQWPMQTPALVIRTAGDPAALAEMIRREIRSVLPMVPSPLMRTMDALLSETVAQPRVQAELLALFAGFALLLAAVGLYGVLAYAVSQRRRELGVRMALGASRRHVLVLILGQGMRLSLAGTALGLAAACALTRVLQSVLYGVRPGDPVTLAAAALLLICVTLAACLLPACRAANLPPMAALRNE